MPTKSTRGSPTSKTASARGKRRQPKEPRTPLERYIAHRKVECSRATWKRNEHLCGRWEIFLAARGTTVLAATKSDAVDFMASWTAWGWAPLTRRQAITDLRTFHAWLVDIELRDKNPWRGIKGPRQPTRIPRVLSEQELRRMDTATAQPTTRALRDRALLALLRSTGARIDALRTLRLGDLDLANKQAIVHTKNDTEQVVFLDDQAVAVVRAWIEHGRPRWAKTRNPAPTAPVLLGRHGRQIGYTACRDALLRAAKRSRLGRAVNPHLFRHTFATHMLESGANLREVQDLLGHKDIKSTMIYTHISQARLRAVYDRAQSGRPGRRAK